MDLGITKTGLLTLLHETLDANEMIDEPHVHIRLIVSRGVKSTPQRQPQRQHRPAISSDHSRDQGRQSLSQDERPSTSNYVGPTRPS